MSTPASPGGLPWKRSRYAFAAVFLITLLAASSFLRLLFFLWFRLPGPVSAGTVAKIFLIGLHQDLLIVTLTVLPLLIWFLVVNEGAFGKLWHRIVFIGGFTVFWAVKIFLLFTSYYFFKEFRSRFNTVSVDYLLYPHEVFINIWESYPVVKVIVVCVLLSLIWVIPVFMYFRRMWYQPATMRARFAYVAGAVALCAVLWPTISLEGTHFSSDRTLNEIANNDTISFVAAAWTRDLSYPAFYRTISLDEAYRRVHRLLATSNSKFIGGPHDILRQVAGDPNRPKLNVVILIEESLGSEFWGCLGRKGPSLTPNMDKLATEQGLLFTNIYASGNRTVRGFEGVLSSFPPLPGDSIVKRDRSQNVETVARVLKRQGYSTVFLYGGRGLFDDMKSYALDNGWDRFIEEKDFPHPRFATVWGVDDYEVYMRGIKEFDKLDATGKPFLGTIMSVSNHKPYTYPTGCIPDNPYPPRRNKAVKYADWCLGKFFEAAEKQPFWTNTIFVVVADHGARVYGSQDIPIFSYEIPLVILGPAVVKKPERYGMLGGQVDVTPTVLGLIGRPYKTMFFGRDLLHEPPDTGRAFLNHNRDIGLYSNSQMVVLGLQKTVEFYAGDPKVTNLKLLKKAAPGDMELLNNATALYQVADDLYMHRRYHIDGMAPVQMTSTMTTNVVSR